MPGDNFGKKEISKPPSSKKENPWSPHDAGRSPQGDSFRLNPKTIALGAGVVALGLLGRADAAAAPRVEAYLAKSTEVAHSNYGKGAGYEAPIHPVLKSSKIAPEGRAATNSLFDEQASLSALTTPEVSTPSKTTPDTVTVTKTVTDIKYVTVTQEVANDTSSNEFNPKSFGLGILTAAAGLVLGAVGAGVVDLKLQLRNRVRDRGDAQTESGGRLGIELSQQGRAVQRADNQGRDAQNESGESSETGLGQGPVDQEEDYRAQGL
jgi:hypothetical protein